MERLLIFIIFNLLASAASGSINCRTTVRGKAVAFKCTDQKNLTALDTAAATTTSITIFDSKIPSVHGHAFSRFAARLVTLDLHGSGIEFIDSSAFIGLTKLKKLVLWGNKLRTVPRDWFAYTYSLKTLDLSFNFIEVIDYAVFQMLPNLENFYFDYNEIKFIDYTMFAYLKSLKNVKFEKNPLSWGYRAHLTWQLENQHVQYTEQYENWGWMNVAIKECTDSGYGEIPTDTVLDCVVAKLLDFTHEVFSTEIGQSNNVCANHAVGLVQCMRSQNRQQIKMAVCKCQTVCRCQPVVTICRLDGPRLQIRIRYSETIGYLKQQLAELLHERHRKWKPERMRLWIRGYYLEDNRTLSDYNLTSEDRIMLLLDDRYLG